MNVACVYTVSQKNSANFFLNLNFVIFPPVLIIFGRKMEKRLKLCEMESFLTAPNSCHHTTMLDADVPNCYSTLIIFSVRLLAFPSSIR